MELSLIGRAVLIGFVIGVLAKFLYPGRDKLGFIFTTLLGIGGSYAAGNGFNFLSVAWGVIGSAVLIAILKALKILR